MDAELIVGGVVVLAVLAFVVWPAIAGQRARRPVATIDDERIEARVAEYRDALRRRTVCARCLNANVAGARFCAECGARLAGDADRDAA